MGPILRSKERILVKIKFEGRPVLMSIHHDSLLFMVLYREALDRLCVRLNMYLVLHYFYSSHATFLRSERGVYEISVRSMNIDDRPTNERRYDRPTTDLRAYSHVLFICKISNSHNSADCNASTDPLHVWF